jgi:putative addiction module component (TIGR02574 family)
MTTIEIREKVNEYLDNADERMRKVVYAMLKEYENTPAQKSVLSDEQYKEMEKRLKNYKSGKSKGYTIAQVREHVKKQLVK